MESVKDLAAELRSALEADARSEGFSAIGIVNASSTGTMREQLRSFIDQGHHGTMEWLEETFERRSDPKRLWKNVRSIILLTMNYGPEGDALETLADKLSGNISVYARNRDYHDVMKGKLKGIADRLKSKTGKDVKVFVDTAPVMEKPLAAAAGLGWQGKHTNLVSRSQGSWFFLGSIYTEAELAFDEPEVDHCGSCRACLDACPTDAFPAPYQLDARRCISYLTIEHKGPIPLEFRKAIGNRIYGCDDCLAACPWNKFAVAANEIKLKARADLVAPPLAFLLGLDDDAFRRFFTASPIKRIGRNQFIRNVLIAAGNSQDAAMVEPVVRRLSDGDAAVRQMAVWALRELLGADAAKPYIDDESETDADVIAEIKQVQN
ncbi:MAG: tRNA epoxyqueuosine(34) reductase QueG [Rhizobiaceae bacterium]